MGYGKLNNSDTVNNKAGKTGLWKTGVKLNRMAIAWKRLEAFNNEGIGIPEVEHAAWKRSANRAVKKGMDWNSLKKGEYNSKCRRDNRYVEKEMLERIRQARTDWQEMRTEFMKQKDRTIGAAENKQKRNEVKRKIKQLKKENEQVYKRAEAETSQKITWAKNKYKKYTNLTLEQHKSDQLDTWADDMTPKGVELHVWSRSTQAG